MSFRPPETAGYTTPTPATQSFVLGAATTTHDFAYTAASGTPTPAPTTPAAEQPAAQLANTGTRWVVVVALAGTIVFGAVLVLRRNRVLRYMLVRR